ncbi:MAG: AAA family ATPase [Deltaproteobacteria bacterium]|nr:AAA family ATPase [Deltaproteobacteria bacterium]
MPQHSDRSRAHVPKALPTRLIADIPVGADEPQWLVESLWAASGVGIIGGLPKSLKTWLAADLAVSVASGTPALGRFAVSSQGPVLVFVAEGGSRALRARFESVAKARAVSLAGLQVHEIDVPALYLDEHEHWADLRKTIEELRPRLLILDPFVRIIARVDENSAQEVSRVLGSLRALQREFDLAVLLVHHLRKSPSPRLGQRLRGSGDFAAWYDSGLYLVKQGDDDLILYAEHRDAPALSPLRVRLELSGAPHLVVVEDLAGHSSQPDSLGTCPRGGRGKDGGEACGGGRAGSEAQVDHGRSSFAGPFCLAHPSGRRLRLPPSTDLPRYWAAIGSPRP